MRRWTRRMVGAGALAAAAYAVWRAIEARRVDTGVSWQHQPFPYPPVPRTDTAPPTTAAPTTEPASQDHHNDGEVTPVAEGGVAWVEPAGDVCPTSHPVKGKLASGIFHLPGGANYERTKPDRCYVSGAAAEADGLRGAAR